MYLEIMFWKDYPSKEQLLLVLEYSSVWNVYIYTYSQKNTWYKEQKWTHANWSRKGAYCVAIKYSHYLLNLGHQAWKMGRNQGKQAAGLWPSWIQSYGFRD